VAVQTERSVIAEDELVASEDGEGKGMKGGAGRFTWRRRRFHVQTPIQYTSARMVITVVMKPLGLLAGHCQEKAVVRVQQMLPKGRCKHHYTLRR